MRSSADSLPRRANSLTARLTFLFAGVSACVLLALGLVVGTLVERHFEDMDLELLHGKRVLVEHALQADRSADFSALAQQLDVALIGHHGLAVGVWLEDGRLLYQNGEVSLPSLPALASAGPVQMQLDSAGERQRVLVARAPTGRGGQHATLVLSAALAHHDAFMQSFRHTLWRVVGLAALLSGLLGWWAARRGLAPLRQIARRASDITASKLDQRLETGKVPRELAEVTAQLNGMLARLEASFKRLAEFSSDIAHELRTPVSNLLMQTQVTLSKARSVQEYQDVLASNAEEFERLSRIIADMLFLAKADHHLLIPARHPVDLHREVGSLLEYYEAPAAENRIDLRCIGEATAWGDALMLRRAISNLLSNAVRHTPAAGCITVRLSASGDGVCIAVENSGPGIPAGHLPRLFDRFYRGDAARLHAGEGAGLGLAIVRSIAQAHGGDVQVQSTDGSTVFSIFLPPPTPAG